MLTTELSETESLLGVPAVRLGLLALGLASTRGFMVLIPPITTALQIPF